MNVVTAVSFAIAQNMADAVAMDLGTRKNEVHIDVRNSAAGVKFVIWRLARAEVEKVELIASATSMERLRHVAYAFMVHAPIVV
jgi:hypothetical protein